MTGQRARTWPLHWTASLAARVVSALAGEAKVPVQPLVLLAQRWQRQAVDDAASPVGTPGWACGHAMGDTRRACADQLLTALAAALRGGPVNASATVAGPTERSTQ